MSTEALKDGLEKIQAGLNILSGGPASYYIECVMKARELLLTKYAPFKAGDRVELAVTPEITKHKSYGWIGSKHFLVEGAKATVLTVDIDRHDLTFGVEFDEETWIDRDGVKRPVSRKHSYGFRAEALRAQVPTMTYQAAVERFLSTSGQYVTNDASRQAAIDEELEKAAAACDEQAASFGGVASGTMATERGKAILEAMAAGAMNCAAAIRALKGKP